MARVVRIGRPPYSPDLIAELRGARLLLHVDPNQDGLRALTDAGLPVIPLGEEIPDDAWLLVPSATGPLETLVQVADRLLAPGGCPWDREQTHESLKRYLLEEVYELFDAIDAADDAGMLEELGDLILQPILHAAMKRRDGSFDIDAVATAITEKLIHRHPHVFGDTAVADTEEVLRNWDRLKAAERADKPRPMLAGVPRTLPSLQRAFEVSKRTARVGFDWPDLDSVWQKVREEERELDEAIASGDKGRIEAEFADLVFGLVNVARWLDVEPEGALRGMIDRFSARFAAMEAEADRPLTELSAAQWDELWRRAKSTANEAAS